MKSKFFCELKLSILAVWKEFFRKGLNRWHRFFFCFVRNETFSPTLNYYYFKRCSCSIFRSLILGKMTLAIWKKWSLDLGVFVKKNPVMMLPVIKNIKRKVWFTWILSLLYLMQEQNTFLPWKKTSMFAFAIRANKRQRKVMLA